MTKPKSKILSVILAVTLVFSMMPLTALAEDPEYDPGDIAVINNIIETNGLNLTKADPADGTVIPADWTGKIEWNSNNPRRITQLYWNWLSGNKMTGTLDVSGLARLQILHCSGNSLAGINVGDIIHLQILSCSNNSITGILDLSSVTSLKFLYCAENQLTGLRLHVNAPLASIDVSNNFIASTTDITGPTIAWGNADYTFEPQNSPDAKVHNLGDLAIINDIIQNNNLNWTPATVAGDDAGKNVPANWSGITWSDAQTNKRITGLTIGNRGLEGTLNVSGLTSLKNLNCENNKLTGINVSGLTSLETLYCSTNPLSALNLSGLTSLEMLVCQSNSLTELDVSDLANLQALFCSNNSLTELDVSDLANLQALVCSNNSLTELDVSDLANLQSLVCSNNRLTSLQFHSSAPLESSVDVSYNRFANQSAITGKTISWDQPKYIYDPQYGATDAPHSLNDIAVINSIIEKNGLDWTKADPTDGWNIPSDWKNVQWDNSVTINKRIFVLYLDNAELTGVLDVNGLTDLRGLYCYGNYLTGIKLDQIATLETFYCSGNILTELKLNSNAPYDSIDVRSNFMADKSAVTGREINWDNENFFFGTQSSPNESLATPVVNITAPVAGVNSAPATNGTGYTMTSTAWSITDGDGLTLGDPFEEGTAYTATVVLTADPECRFFRVVPGNITGTNGMVVSATIDGATNSNTLTLVVNYPATGSASDNPIDIPAISGVTPPVRGAVPVTAITETNQYTGTVAWSPSVSGTFAPNQIYTATITLTPKSGYKLTGVAENFFTVAGTSSAATNAANSGVITAVFPATDAAPDTEVNSAAVTVITPVTGNAPVTTALTAGTGYTCSTVSWSPSHNPFQGITQYTASVTLTATSGYTFPSGLTATINGSSATVLGAPGNSVTVSYEFPATDAAPDTEVSSATVTVTAPVTGNAPVTTAPTADTGYTCSAVSWSPSHNLFQGITQYTASVVLTAASGYTFPSGFTATINGQTATVLGAPGNSVTVSYQFPATGAATINISAILGVTPPVAEAVPVTAITETAQYTGIVSWNPSDSPFDYSKVYTATITLTPKSGYTLTGVSANYFTVAGATTVNNSAGSETITAVFPATGSASDVTIDISAISGVTPPVAGVAPVTAITETDQYTGTVTWAPADASFDYSKVYTATITLTPKSGYTLSGVTANYFTVVGTSTPATNAANSGVITAVFPETAGAPSGYTITFNASGGTLTSVSTMQTGTDGKLLSLPSDPTRSDYNFKGWYTAVSGGTKISTSYIFTGDATVYAQWTAKSNNTGGGSSNSPSVPQTVPTGDGTATVSYTKSGDTVVLAMPDSKVTEIISKAKDDTAIFDLSKVSNVTEAQLPTQALEKLADAGLAMELKLPGATLNLSDEAVQSIAQQADSSNVGIELKNVNTSSLTQAQQQAIKAGDTVVDISILSGGKNISNFNGELTATMPYSGPLPAGVWYLNDQGELERLTCRYDENTKTISFTMDHLSLYVIGQDTAWQNPFADVLTTAWYYGDVEYVYANGMMTGTSDTIFAPNTNLSRAMLVTVLWRLEGSPEPDPIYAAHMMDVEQGSWYEKAMGWAVENSIISGYGEGFYGPADPITRQQMATILYRYAGTPALSAGQLDFTDAGNVADWARDAMIWATAGGVITGKPGDLLDPQGSTTRAETAAMLHRFLKN